MTGEIYDNPNQQVVRPDGSGPGIEGEAPGGEEELTGLDAMTKAELLEYAQQIGATPANNDMTKAEIRASVDAKLAEGA